MAAPRAYQLDHQADSTGKHIASTKRRILFRFGTLRPGHTRASVNDAQHIITLSWSPTSGHTILACDGREVVLRNAQRMPPRVEGRFEESWILGEEGGITRTNDHGVHLRIVARAVSGGAMKGRIRSETGAQRTAGTRSKSRKGGRGKASSRQFDLYIDGRSYFDLPFLAESTGELAAAPTTGNDLEYESSNAGSCDQEEEEEATEEGASVEDWAANGSAIAINDDDDDDLDSVDGFMANIDLSGKNEGADLLVEKSNKGSGATSTSDESHKAARGHRITSAKSNLQRSTARTAEKISNSTKKGTKKFVASASKVFNPPIALIKRKSVDNRKGDGSCSSEDEQVINDGKTVEEGLGNGMDGPATSSSSREKDPQFSSFSALHSTMVPLASAGGQQQKDRDTKIDYEEDTPEEIIIRLREQIVHLEREIAHNVDRVAVEVQRSVAASKIEAQVVRERDQGEIMRLQEELKEMKEDTTSQLSQAKALKSELEVAKIEAQKLKDVAKAAEKKSKEFQSGKDTAEEEIRRLKEHAATLEEALVCARTARRKDSPFVPNDTVTSYLDDPKCCLCCKDATENMRDCQCGKDDCDLQAHVSCLIGSNHHPTPSVSHPGTPAPTLPLILCRGLFKK